MAQNPFSEACISKMNPLEKSGYPNTGAVTNACFRVLSTSWWSAFHSNGFVFGLSGFGSMILGLSFFYLHHGTLILWQPGLWSHEDTLSLDGKMIYKMPIILGQSKEEWTSLALFGVS